MEHRLAEAKVKEVEFGLGPVWSVVTEKVQFKDSALEMLSFHLSAH